MTKQTESDEQGAARLERLNEKVQLINSGNAGVNKQGQVVDIREFPDAVRIPKH